MEKLSLRTILYCIVSLEEKIKNEERRLDDIKKNNEESSQFEERLSTYLIAKEQLKKVYTDEEKTASNFPPYEEVVANYSKY